MIKSMTGYGRNEVMENGKKITVEMKAVNHRYLDENIKMPKKLVIFESAMRGVLKDYVSRGKVDVFVTLEDFTEENVTVKYNKNVAAEYLKHLKAMQEDFGLENDVRVSTLSRYPEVFTMEDAGEDEEELWKLLEKATRGAAEAFVESRTREGEHLKNDLIGKLDGMLETVDFIEKRSPELVAEYRTKLTNKVKELLSDSAIDENRILQETVIYADKICVDEEMVRLRSHIEATKKELTKGGSVGRKLDFIAQEMNREANTTLSKTTDLGISEKAIDLKTEIEKVREQIQNIE